MTIAIGWQLFPRAAARAAAAKLPQCFCNSVLGTGTATFGRVGCACVTSATGMQLKIQNNVAVSLGRDKDANVYNVYNVYKCATTVANFQPDGSEYHHRPYRTHCGRILRQVARSRPKASCKTGSIGSTQMRVKAMKYNAI